MAKKQRRADEVGQHRTTYEKNRKRVLQTESVCGICGRPVDKELKPPHPMAPCIDHIVPIARGGHPSAIENLQLAHWTCNRQKSDKLIERGETQTEVVRSLRNLPQSKIWQDYRP